MPITEASIYGTMDHGRIFLADLDTSLFKCYRKAIYMQELDVQIYLIRLDPLGGQWTLRKCIYLIIVLQPP